MDEEVADILHTYKDNIGCLKKVCF